MTDNTRLAALEAVAEAAREIAGQLLLTEMTEGDRWSADVEAAYAAMIERIRPAIRALDALPAPTPGQESRKIAQMVTGRDADDVCLEYALCTDGTAWLLQWEDCKPIGWKQLPPIPATVTVEVTP